MNVMTNVMTIKTITEHSGFAIPLSRIIVVLHNAIICVWCNNAECSVKKNIVASKLLIFLNHNKILLARNG